MLVNDTDLNGLRSDRSPGERRRPGAWDPDPQPDGSFTYTPDKGFAGTDSFTYLAKDSLSQSTPTTVTLTVTAAGAANARPIPTPPRPTRP